MPSCRAFRSLCSCLAVSGLIWLHPLFVTVADAQTQGKPIATQIGRFFGWGYSHGGYHSSWNGAATRAQPRHHAVVTPYSNAVHVPGQFRATHSYPVVDSRMALPRQEHYPPPTPTFRNHPHPSVAEPTPPHRMESHRSGSHPSGLSFPAPHLAEEVPQHGGPSPRPTAILGSPAPSAKPAYMHLQPLADSPRIAPLPAIAPDSESLDSVPAGKPPAIQPDGVGAAEDLLHNDRTPFEYSDDLLLESDTGR